MHKWKTALLLAFVLITVWSVAAVAASAPRYRQSDLNRLMEYARLAGGADEATAESNAGRTFGSTAMVGALPSASPGTAVGLTTYDYQHNGSTGRQVDRFGTTIQALWMDGSQNTVALGRNVHWNKVSVTGSPVTITLDNGDTVSRIPLGNPLLAPDATLPSVAGTRPGYTTFRNLPTGRGIGFMHDAPDDTLLPASGLAAPDFGAAVGIFNINFAPQPAGIGTGDEVIWPHGTVDVVGSDTVVHMVGRGSSSNTYDPVYYWRGIVSGTSVSWETPIFMDSAATISQIVEADPTSDEVAVLYTRTINYAYDGGTAQVYNNLILRRSTNGGVSFGAAEYIPGPGPIDTLVEGRIPYTDIDAVYDEDGTLHVLYNTRTYEDDGTGELAIFNVPADLMHWNDVRGTSRVITTADWSNDCNQEGNPFTMGGWNLLVAKPSITVKPAGANGIADEILYAIWAQAGPTDTLFIGNDTLFDCATQSDSVTLGGYANNELYCSASSNDGLTWDRPVNITGTQTPDCVPGDCHSEHWVTAAARADSGVYLSFTDDTHAGGIPQDEGAWSLSPYMVYVVESRTPVLEPRIRVTPTNFVELNVSTTGSKVDTIEVSNLGNSDLTFDVVVTGDDGGVSYVQVNGGASYNSTIAAAGDPELLVIEYDGLGLPDPSEYDWRLEITSNDVTNDPGQGGTAIDVNLNVFVADTWYTCDSDTLSTGLHRLAIGSCLDIGNQGASGGLYNYANETEWLYSASPVLVKRNAGGSVKNVFRNVFWNTLAERSRDSNVAFRAQSDITVQRGIQVISGEDTLVADVATGVASSTDSTLTINWEASAFQTDGLRTGGVVKYTVSPGPVSDGLTGFLDIGAMADVDLDSSSGFNLGLADEAKQYVGGRGGFLSATDSLFTAMDMYAALFYIPLDDSCKDLASGGQVIDNQWYVYDNSEGGGVGAFDSDTLAKWMQTDLVGWNADVFPPDSLIDGTTDVTVLMKDRTEPWTETETYEFALGVAISNLSVSDLESTIAKLRSAVNSVCISGCPITLSGDVNLSGSITSADIIYLVNFVFKGQAGPQPCDASGDVNCSNSVTSADIIYLVNFVFKGQAAPCDACTSGLAGQC